MPRIGRWQRPRLNERSLPCIDHHRALDDRLRLIESRLDRALDLLARVADDLDAGRGAREGLETGLAEVKRRPAARLRRSAQRRPSRRRPRQRKRPPPRPVAARAAPHRSIATRRARWRSRLVSALLTSDVNRLGVILASRRGRAAGRRVRDLSQCLAASPHRSPAAATGCATASGYRPRRPSRQPRQRRLRPSRRQSRRPAAAKPAAAPAAPAPSAAAPVTATLTIVSDVPGAQVFLDRRSSGRRRRRRPTWRRVRIR